MTIVVLSDVAKADRFGYELRYRCCAGLPPDGGHTVCDLASGDGRPRLPWSKRARCRLPRLRAAGCAQGGIRRRVKVIADIADSDRALRVTARGPQELSMA